MDPFIKDKILKYTIDDYLFNDNINYSIELKTRVKNYYIKLFNLCTTENQLILVILEDIRSKFYGPIDTKALLTTLETEEEHIEPEFQFLTKLDKLKKENQEIINSINKLRLEHLILKG